MIRKGRFKEVLTLLKEAKKNEVALKDIFGTELEYSWLGEQGCKTVHDMLNQFFKKDTHAQKVGEQILNFYKKKHMRSLIYFLNISAIIFGNLASDLQSSKDYPCQLPF